MPDISTPDSSDNFDGWKLLKLNNSGEESHALQVWEESLPPLLISKQPFRIIDMSDASICPGKSGSRAARSKALVVPTCDASVAAPKGAPAAGPAQVMPPNGLRWAPTGTAWGYIPEPRSRNVGRSRERYHRLVQGQAHTVLRVGS